MRAEHTSRNMPASEVLLGLGLCFGLALAWWVYQPAMPGFFMLDDFDNLAVLAGGVSDSASLYQYLTTANAGPLGRPIAKLSFLLNDQAWPSEPGGFKHTNLMLHLLVGLLVFVVCRQLLYAAGEGERQALALFVAVLWLLHPLQVSTVMYVVQRMTQLSALFVLAGIASHLALRRRLACDRPWHLLLLGVSLAAWTLLAAFSKESGVLLPLFILAAEFTVLARQPVPGYFLWWRRLCVWLPSLALLAYITYLPQWVPAYGARDFDLWQRLLTQVVILADYLGRIFSLRVAGLGLFQDDYPIYSSIFQPAVLAGLAVLVAMLAVAFRWRHSAPIISLGILWFLAGHWLESTTVPLELYFEHRNYLPMIGPLLAAAWLGSRLLARFPDLKRLSLPLGAVILLLAGAVTRGYATEWGEPQRLLPIWAAEHPDSPRAQRTYAQLLAGMGMPEAALMTLDESYARFPQDLSIPVMSVDIACAFGLPLRYEFEELARSTGDHRWTDGLRPAMASLAGRILGTSCADQVSGLHALIDAVPEIQGGENRRSSIASMFVISGNLYMRRGLGDEALRAFRLVDELAPSPDAMLRISNLYLGGHRYEQARNALGVALMREQASSRVVPEVRLREYQEKFDMINERERQWLAGQGQADE